MLFSKGFFLLKLGTARSYSRLWLYNENWVFAIVEGSDSNKRSIYFSIYADIPINYWVTQ